MSAFFANFPKIYYGGKVVRNVMLKSQFFTEILDRIDVFYPYIVKDHERADTIAHHYYGHSDYSWLVHFSNQVIDPHFEWPMNNADFNAYIIKKYGTVEEASTTVSHYVYDPTVEVDDPEYDYRLYYEMQPDTYDLLTVEEKSYWDPVYVYEREFNNNENKRNIRLLDNDYLPKVEVELAKIFN